MLVLKYPELSGYFCDTISSMNNSSGFLKKTMFDVPLRGKTILLRADYNVPLTKDGTVKDDYRIKSSVPTVKKLLENGCKVVIISHLGRPDGAREMKYSLEPAALRLSALLGEPVRFADDCVGNKARMAIKRAPKRSVIVLENLRFHPEEEANDHAFAQKLAKDSGADYFVQDGFGVVHRAHASTDAITMCLPSVAGLLLEREYVTITSAMSHPKRPLVAVLGGAKVSDKIGVIKALIPVADTIIIGGAMANTFLANKGHNLGKSKFETGQDAIISEIYKQARKKVGENTDDFLVLPTDLGVGTSTELTATRKNASLQGVGTDGMALDIGEKSIARMKDIISNANTVIWNGGLGMAEIPAFREGSVALAESIATHKGITSIIGGGDTADFALNWDKKKGKSFTHVSTGGGASLELMSGLTLPGVASLLDA